MAARAAELRAKRLKFLQQRAQSKRQQADNRQDAAKQAASRRAEQMRRASQSRRVQHTVKKTDSIESIARRYSMTPQDALSQAGVQSLRAGQVLTFDSIRAEKEYKPPTPRADLTGQAGPLATSPIGRNPRTGEPIYREGGGSPRTDRLMTFLKGLDEGRPQVGEYVPGEGQIIGRSPKTGEPVYGEGTGNEIHPELLTQEFAQEQIQEQIARGNFGNTMRYTGQALMEAWNTGNRDFLPNYLTDYMLAQFSQATQEKIIGMGYYRNADGVWVVQDVEEAGYGMGGWEYPGYGSAAYEEKTYSKGASSGRGGAGGVRTRMESGQLYAGNTPRSSWRI